MKEVKLLKLRTLNNTSILFIRIWWSSFLLKWKFVKVNKTKDLGQFSKISILIIIWYCWGRIAIGFKADAKWSVHNFFPKLIENSFYPKLFSLQISFEIKVKLSIIFSCRILWMTYSMEFFNVLIFVGFCLKLLNRQQFRQMYFGFNFFFS